MITDTHVIRTMYVGVVVTSKCWVHVDLQQSFATGSCTFMIDLVHGDPSDPLLMVLEDL